MSTMPFSFQQFPMNKFFLKSWTYRFEVPRNSCTSHLTEPFAGIEMKNRLIRSATWENMADRKGRVTQRIFEMIQPVAMGGVG